MVAKTYAGMLGGRVQRVTEQLFDDDEGGFKGGNALKSSGCTSKREELECM